MSCRFVAVVIVALCCVWFGDAPLAAVARHHKADGTGLAAIRYAQTPPDFTFDTPAGPTRLAALFGRPIVLNFWATWCEPCQAEVGAFATLRKTYGDAVEMLTVSEDTTPGAAEAYLRAHGVDAISVDDPERKIFDRYTVVPIPVTLVLAPSGQVTHVSVGELDWTELQAAVSAVLPTNLILPHDFGTVSLNASTQSR